MNPIEIPASTTSPVASSKPASSTTPGRRSRRRNKASESLSKDFYEIYELDQPIGQGSCAVVRKAKHRRTGKFYAVKCVQTPTNGVEYRRVREKCLNEMMVLKACEDSNKIIQLHDFKEDQHHFFMVFELVEGGNLQELLDDRDGGKLSLNEAACVIKDLATGLRYLHAKGIVHRDMKPDNILCCSDDFASPCKIIDFDLAKAHEADNSGNANNNSSNAGTYSGNSYNQKSNLDSGIDHSSPDLGMSPISGNWRDRSESPNYGMYRPDQRYLPMTSPVGSPEYMPPEIVEKCLDDYYNLDEYNQSCDIWSLGIISYMTISGRPPFVAQTADCSYKDCEWNYVSIRTSSLFQMEVRVFVFLIM
jgi:serine/threonine protein kinase